MITPRCSPLRSFVSPVVAGLLLSASPLSAALVLQTANSGSGTSWATGSIWVSNAGASAGNDYHTNGYTLRTPDGVNIHPVFDGDSLTVDGGAGGARGELLLKAGTSTISNLLIGVGTVRNAVASGSNPATNHPATLTVTNLTIMESATSDNAAIFRGTWYLNDITLNVANLLGSGHLQFAKTTQNDNSKRLFVLSVADASSFTGTLELAHGTLELAAALNMSKGKLTMATTDTTLRLTSSVTVSSFAFGSTQLDAGSYTSAELNALFSTNAFTGSGLLQVAQIPEPSSFALAMGGAMLTVCGVRRHARTIDAAR